MVRARGRIEQVAMIRVDEVAGVVEAVAVAEVVGISALRAVVKVTPAAHPRAAVATMSCRTLIEPLTSVDRNRLIRSQHRKRWKMSSTIETTRAKRAATIDAERPDRVLAKDSRVQDSRVQHNRERDNRKTVRTFSERVVVVDVDAAADAATTRWNLDRARAVAMMRSRLSHREVNSMAISTAMWRSISPIDGTWIGHLVSMKMRKV